MTKVIKDARVHYAVLNIRAGPIPGALPARNRAVQRQNGPAGRIRPKKALPLPQDPTVCLVDVSPASPFHSGEPVVLGLAASTATHVNVPPLSFPLPNTRRQRALSTFRCLDAP